VPVPESYIRRQTNPPWPAHANRCDFFNEPAELRVISKSYGPRSQAIAAYGTVQHAERARRWTVMSRRRRRSHAGGQQLRASDAHRPQAAPAVSVPQAGHPDGHQKSMLDIRNRYSVVDRQVAPTVSSIPNFLFRPDTVPDDGEPLVIVETRTLLEKPIVPGKPRAARSCRAFCRVRF